ncbi:protein of unknown function [Methylocaldum szegediense]|uniref:Uncharacterized protein n=1 Tax=Methylocaldum szegediense TaxID=73780 RepID=A0ABM9I181_9GAMM|nr:protein of unknown function [Methylocaldum szegediense]
MRHTRDSVASSETPAVLFMRLMQAGFRAFYRLRPDLRGHSYDAHHNRTRVSAYSTIDIRRHKDFADLIGQSQPRTKSNRLPTTVTDPIRR